MIGRITALHWSLRLLAGLALAGYAALALYENRMRAAESAALASSPPPAEVSLDAFDRRRHVSRIGEVNVVGRIAEGLGMELYWYRDGDTSGEPDVTRIVDMLLAPGTTPEGRTVHAAVIYDAADAERVAARLQAEGPDSALVRVNGRASDRPYLGEIADGLLEDSGYAKSGNFVYIEPWLPDRAAALGRSDPPDPVRVGVPGLLGLLLLLSLGVRRRRTPAAPVPAEEAVAPYRPPARAAEAKAEAGSAATVAAAAAAAHRAQDASGLYTAPRAEELAAWDAFETVGVLTVQDPHSVRTVSQTPERAVSERPEPAPAEPAPPQSQRASKAEDAETAAFLSEIARKAAEPDPDTAPSPEAAPPTAAADPPPSDFERDAARLFAMSGGAGRASAAGFPEAAAGTGSGDSADAAQPMPPGDGSLDEAATAPEPHEGQPVTASGEGKEAGPSPAESGDAEPAVPVEGSAENPVSEGGDRGDDDKSATGVPADRETGDAPARARDPVAAGLSRRLGGRGKPG